MQVISQPTGTEHREFIVSVGIKGQIAMPKAIRRKLKLKPKDKVAIRLEEGTVTVKPMQTTLASIYQLAAPLKLPRTDQEMAQQAWEEHVQEVAHEAL